MLFSTEGVTQAPNTAEATARYWAWRMSNAGSPEAELLLRAKVNQTQPDVRGDTFTGDPFKEFFADRIVRNHGAASTPAGRLAVYQALRDDLEVGLTEETAENLGIHYQTDYYPVGRLADVLRGIDSSGLPAKTQSYTYPNFAYVAEQGEPITIIHGDLPLAQAHIIEGYRVSPEQIVVLGSATE